MMNWIKMARDRIARDGAVVRASLVGVRGSAPREAGAMMLISTTDIWQTIGGGSLEFEVMAKARAMLAAPPTPWARQVISAALGPDMGQCCGGHVKVLLERFGVESAVAKAVTTVLKERPADPIAAIGQLLLSASVQKGVGVGSTFPMSAIVHQGFAGNTPDAPKPMSAFLTGVKALVVSLPGAFTPT